MPQYLNANGHSIQGAPAGSQLDELLAASPDWTLIRPADAPAPAPEPDPEPEPVEGDLDKLHRPELDELARTLGVPEPDKLPNKPAVIAAIKAAEQVAKGGDAE